MIKIMKLITIPSQIKNLFNTNTIYLAMTVIALSAITIVSNGSSFGHLFYPSNHKLHITLIDDGNIKASEKDNSFLKGLNEGLTSIERKDAIPIEIVAKFKNNEDSSAKSLIQDKNLLAIVSPLSLSNGAQIADFSEESKIPALLSKNQSKELQDPTWAYSIQSNSFKKSGLITNLLLKNITPKRIAVVVTKEDGNSPYFSGITQSILDSNVQVESTEIIKLENIDDAKTNTGIVQFDLIYLDLPSDYAAGLIQNLKDKNYSGNIVAFDDKLDSKLINYFSTLPKEKEHAGYYLRGVKIVSNFSQYVTNVQGRTLTQKFFEKHNEIPSSEYINGYDTGALIASFFAQNNNQNQFKNLTLEEIRNQFRNWLNNSDKNVIEAINFNGPFKFGVNHERDTVPKIEEFKDGNLLEPYALQYADFPATRVSDDDRTLKIDYNDPHYAIVNHFKYPIVPVAFTGIHLSSIDDISINKGLFNVDFEIWFRSKVNIDPHDISFYPPPEDPVKIEVLEEIELNQQIYKRFKVKGKLPFIIQPKDIGLNTLNFRIRWYDKKLDSGNLLLVIDYDAINFKNKLDPIYQKVNREGVISPSTGYSAIFSMISAVDLSIPSFGNLSSDGNTNNYSSGWLDITLSSSSSIFSKAKLVNILKNLTLGIISLLFFFITLVLFQSKRYFPKFNCPKIFLYLGSFFFIYFFEVFFFTNDYVQSLPREWMLIIRNCFNFIYYMLLASIICQIITYVMLAKKSTRGIRTTILKVIITLIYVVAAAFFYTNVLEKDILPILATSSVILTVVGLAIRDVIFDFISGIAISSDKTFKLDQWINFQVKDRRIDGKIEELGWRNVHIKSKDEMIHVIPNSQIYAQVISNASISNGYRRIDASFITNTHISIDYLYGHVMEVSLEVLKNVKGVPLQKPIRLIFEKITADGLQLKLQFFLKDEESGESARSVVLNAIHKELFNIQALPAKMVQNNILDSDKLIKSSVDV